MGSIFVYAGIVKLLNINIFAHTIDQYDLIPDTLLPAVAVGLPAFEVIAGLGMIFDITGSLTAILALLMLFVSVLAYGIINNMDIDCGCFSPDEAARRGNLAQALYRDLAMIAAVMFLFVHRRLRPSNSQSLSLWGKIRSFKGGI